MAAWNSPRFLAPLALGAAFLGVILVVALSRVEAPEAERSLQPSSTARQATQPAKPRARTYVVKPGDNLTIIAEKTDVDVETLERLNPDVDPQALQAGERLKLAP
jgi:LysM repeat protein